MAIEPVNGVGASNASSNASPQLNQDDFIKLFMSQLRAQDPLEPVNNQDFLAQMAQFSLLEANRVTNNELASIKRLVETTQGTGLLGKRVETASVNGDITGEVVSMGFTNTGAVVTIKVTNEEGNEYYIDDLPLSRVRQVYSEEEE
ncbi:flagellar hook assembly protein FlgD [Vibrio vulnificus]|nr:hypothetical protein [Vibrio vulnificus]ELX4197059.1 hypothetical protein [Vibrio vulnificus]